MHKLWRNEKGLTLVEIVVALFLLSLVILTTFAWLTTGITINDSVKYRIHAMNLAEETLETWKYEPTINVSPGFGHPPTVLLPATAHTIGSKIYTVEVTGQRYNATGPLKFARITVSVTWSDKGNNRDIQLQIIRKV